MLKIFEGENRFFWKVLSEGLWEEIVGLKN